MPLGGKKYHQGKVCAAGGEGLGSLELILCCSPALPYLKVLLELRISGGLLWRGWICSQSTRILLLAAHRGLPSFQLNLGTGNGVRTRVHPGLGRGQDDETQRKSRRRAQKNSTPGKETARWRGERLDGRAGRPLRQAAPELGAPLGAGESPTGGSAAPGSAAGLSRGLPGDSRTFPLPVGTSCRKAGQGSG